MIHESLEQDGSLALVSVSARALLSFVRDGMIDVSISNCDKSCHFHFDFLSFFEDRWSGQNTAEKTQMQTIFLSPL